MLRDRSAAWINTAIVSRWSNTVPLSSQLASRGRAKAAREHMLLPSASTMQGDVGTDEREPPDLLHIHVHLHLQPYIAGWAGLDKYTTHTRHQGQHRSDCLTGGATSNSMMERSYPVTQHEQSRLQVMSV